MMFHTSRSPPPPAPPLKHFTKNCELLLPFVSFIDLWFIWGECLIGIIEKVFIFNGGQYFIEMDHFCYITLGRDRYSVESLKNNDFQGVIHLRIVTPPLHPTKPGHNIVVRRCHQTIIL